MFNVSILAFWGLVADLTNESALDVGGTSEVILAEGALGDSARVLGTRPSLGRWFAPKDERTTGGQFLTVISYRVWQSRFGGDSQVVGKQVRLKTHRHRR